MKLTMGTSVTRGSFLIMKSEFAFVMNVQSVIPLYQIGFFDEYITTLHGGSHRILSD